ncbi:MAG: serine dehydratase [bacterium]|nr:serine dehydratase [bacterium]
MKSLKELYRIGYGPSSSHTMAPSRAATNFKKKNSNASSFRVTLSGSLALTGKGHLTDFGIKKSFSPTPIEFIWLKNQHIMDHPNGFILEALDNDGKVIDKIIDSSVGGGALASDGNSIDTYTQKTMADILDYCNKENLGLWEYVQKFEDKNLWLFLNDIWTTMRISVKKGLQGEGIIPGGLNLTKKAGLIKRKSLSLRRTFKFQALLAAYAYAASEENACGNKIVTAPTCGSCGVMPAVLTMFYNELGCEPKEILYALAAAGVVGNLAKANGSISGAVAGCQAEIGVACAMAAAAATQLLGGTNNQIEYAAEMGLEHHLGLTCDPVKGLVQIPCIERNAHAAVRAINCANFAMLSDGEHRISYDDVVHVLLETGHQLHHSFKETSTGGLATVYSD